MVAIFEQIAAPTVRKCYAFSVGTTGGNPAAVIVTNRESDVAVELAKETARRCGVETTLVAPSSETACIAKFRFFVPTAEMAMCGHGTLAALAALHEIAGVAPGVHCIETQASLLGVRIEHGATLTEAEILTIGNEVRQIFRPSDARAMLHIDGLDPSNIVIVFVGGNLRAKTYIEVRAGCVDYVAPTPAQVRSICAEHATTGIYVYSRIAELSTPTVEARHFPATGGLYEDPATGVAAGSLACYLNDHACNLDSLTIYQGRVMGNGSKLNVRRGTAASDWWVGGQIRIDPHDMCTP